MTSACRGFSLAVSGMMIPPTFCSASSILRTRTRSRRGFTFAIRCPPVVRVMAARLPSPPRPERGSDARSRPAGRFADGRFEAALAAFLGVFTW